MLWEKNQIVSRREGGCLLDNTAENIFVIFISYHLFVQKVIKYTEKRFHIFHARIFFFYRGPPKYFN